MIAVLFLELAVTHGARTLKAVFAVGIALFIALGGSWDGMSYLERAWALMLGGWFVGTTLWRPAAGFTTRALTAVLGAAATVAAFVAVRPRAWAIIRLTVADRISYGVTVSLDKLQAVQGGQAMSDEFATALEQTTHMLQTVFPAVLGLASLGGLGAAWWLYRRLARDDDQGVGPLRDFRFNDHLVWIFVGGLVLLIAWWGGALGQVGANAVVFMGALYALRGIAVIVFASGSLGILILGVGFALLFPVFAAGAAIIGLGDTWLDIRSRAPTA